MRAGGEVGGYSFCPCLVGWQLESLFRRGVYPSLAPLRPHAHPRRPVPLHTPVDGRTNAMSAAKCWRFRSEVCQAYSCVVYPGGVAAAGDILRGVEAFF